jgi:hypothetical protein
MAERTRYDRFRRIAGFLALAGAIALLVRQGCGGVELATTTIELRLGDAAADVRSLRADLFDENGASVAFFERSYPVGGVTLTPRFPVTVNPGTYRLDLTVERSGGPVEVTRKVEARDNATVTVYLDDLPAQPPVAPPR